MAPSYSFSDFKARAEKGHVWELRLAQLLRENGFDVAEPVWNMRKEEDVSCIQDFAKNQEDVVVAGKFVIECKSRSLRFTCAEDFPYPDIIVDTTSGWEKKATKPSFYVFWSDKTNGMVVIDGSTRSEWIQKRTTDRARRIKDSFFYAPKHLLRSQDWFLQTLAAEVRSEQAFQMV